MCSQHHAVIGERMFLCLCSLLVFILSCGRLAVAATDTGAASTSFPATGGPSSSVTPAPGGTGATLKATLHPALDAMVTATPDFTVTATPKSEAPSAATQAPSTTAAKTVLSAEGSHLLVLIVFFMQQI